MIKSQNFLKGFVMNLSIVILAAGKGTRMKSTTPKVLHEISGKPMLYHIIKEAKKISNDITVVLSHQAKRVEEQMNSYFDDITYALQDIENYPGTGGALRGIGFKHEKVLILNGDMPLVTSEDMKGFLECGDISKSMDEEFLEIEPDIVMSVIELENPDGYGRVVIEAGEVERIVEQKDATPAQKEIKSVNAGVYLINKDILQTYLPQIDNNNAQEEYYLTDIVSIAKANKAVILPIYVQENRFKGVNSKLDLVVAEEIMQRAMKEELLKSGVMLRMPDTIFIEEGITFEDECEVESGVVLRGDTKIKNSHIKANTIIEDSFIKNSTIGPLARIRPKSIIEDSHIGNFVEVKKSHLKGVKAGHLSYIGDATIDEGSNIGAGTITCNYDGKAKYQTTIGKNVFIGSDTQLVAPIVIEDEVIIAAGTTVTKSVKRGSLVLSRVKQEVKEGFYYKFFKE